MQDVSSYLRSLIASGFSQAEIASACGVSQPTISRMIEKGVERTGPAYRKVTALMEQGGPVKDEYSSPDERVAALDATVRRIVDRNPENAVALDNLLVAIEKYSGTVREPKK